jgi:RNA polymerase sigma factor (sigma-70 family)
MNTLHDKTIEVSTFALPSRVGVTARRCLASILRVCRQRAATQTALRSENWRIRSEKWGCLMVAAQRGQSEAYDQLFRELDAWLRRYYARRLPPAVAEDARQDALLAIHAKRDAYSPSRPFGPWVAAIARHKWIDQVRDASRFATLSLDDGIAIENPGELAINAIAVDDLLRQLKPAQACVIRLVKLQGASIEDASGATGQSAALVKVNIHRGLKKLAALAAGAAVTPARATRSSMAQKFSPNANRANSLPSHRLNGLAAAA